MSGADDELRELEALAREAAPAKVGDDHLSDEALEAIRAGGEDDTAALQHVASCASCRARMVVGRADVQRIVDAARAQATEEEPAGRSHVRPRTSPARSAPPTTTDHRRAKAIVYVAIAAAFLGVTLLSVLRHRGGGALVVSQRSYVGTMGGEAAPPVAPGADKNLELSFPARGAEAAFLLVYDDRGAPLISPRPFVLEEDGRMTVSVAPRTFAPHDGKAHGVVLAGRRADVTNAVEALRQQAPTGFDELEARAGAEARLRGVKMASLVLAE